MTAEKPKKPAMIKVKGMAHISVGMPIIIKWSKGNTTRTKNMVNGPSGMMTAPWSAKRITKMER